MKKQLTINPLDAGVGTFHAAALIVGWAAFVGAAGGIINAIASFVLRSIS